MSPDQRRECEFPLDHPGRLDWDNIPKPDRGGIPPWRLSSHQRTLVHSLLAAGLSEQGYTQEPPPPRGGIGVSASPRCPS